MDTALPTTPEAQTPESAQPIVSPPTPTPAEPIAETPTMTVSENPEPVTFTPKEKPIQGSATVTTPSFWSRLKVQHYVAGIITLGLAVAIGMSIPRPLHKDVLLSPIAAPTATPTATVSATMTPTMTATPTATLTPRPTHVPRYIYLRVTTTPVLTP